MAPSENVVFVLFSLVPLALVAALAAFVRYHRRQKAPAGWGRVLVGNVLGCLLALSLIFVVGESYYRFIYDTTDSLTYTKVSQRWLERYYIRNSVGFRDNIDTRLPGNPGNSASASSAIPLPPGMA